MRRDFVFLVFFFVRDWIQPVIETHNGGERSDDTIYAMMNWLYPIMPLAVVGLNVKHCKVSR